VNAHPEVLVQLRNLLVADAEGFNEHRRQHRNVRNGKDVEVRRSPQAVACRKRYVGELGKPQRLPTGEEMGVGHTATKARKGKPGNRTMRSLSGQGTYERGRRRSTVKGKDRRKPMGCLIRHSTLSVGEPCTWGRT